MQNFFFSILLAISILKERPGKIAYAGIALIFVGLIVLNAKTDNSDIFQSNHFVGNMFIIGGYFGPWITTLAMSY